MPPKPNARNWNDVQTAIATAAIVTTLGMWNLFAEPAKAEETETAQPEEKVPVLPAVVPPMKPPVGFPIAFGPTLMPQVKIMFTQAPSEDPTTVAQQPQERKKKKKKKNDNNGGGGGGGGQTVTQTQSS